MKALIAEIEQKKSVDERELECSNDEYHGGRVSAFDEVIQLLSTLTD